MAREKNSKVKSLLKEHNVAYLGHVKTSKKLRLSFEHNVCTYGLYLAPANMSGYEVCPCSKECRNFCLNGSGHGRISGLQAKHEHKPFKDSQTNKARIKKTKWFFEDKDTFMQVLIAEIERYQKYAAKRNMGFAVRLNCTSDISPEEFTYQGKNILQIFPNVQFYDYTKVPTRFALLEKYGNYDITFSYSGTNWAACLKALNDGAKVAVVFHSEDMPKEFCHIPVVSGNEYDMRYLDPSSTIIGLHYHKTANDYDSKGQYIAPNTPFVVMPNDFRCTW